MRGRCIGRMGKAAGGGSRRGAHEGMMQREGGERVQSRPGGFCADTDYKVANRLDRAIITTWIKDRAGDRTGLASGSAAKEVKQYLFSCV